MTQVVTVHTDFTDLNQMTQGLIGRVNDSHVILPAHEAVDVGEWVQFAVTLYDGSPAFAGVGRCVTFVDNGEDRQPHQRFDVVFDSLQFDTRGQQIYEHILALSGIEPGAEPALEDASNGTGSFVDVSADFSTSSVPAAPMDEGESTTVIASDAEFKEALARSAVHHLDADEVASVPPGDEEPATNPPPASAPAAYRASNGAVNGASFSYPNGLPFPAKPPRPELDASLKVTPAPRPEE